MLLSGNEGSSQLQNGGEIIGRYGSGVDVAGTRADTNAYVLNDGSILGASGVTGAPVTSPSTTSGRIEGTYGSGIAANGNTGVVNEAGAVITGAVSGVSLYGTAADVVNFGTIISDNNGIVLGVNGSVENIGGKIEGLHSGVGIETVGRRFGAKRLQRR